MKDFMGMNTSRNGRTRSSSNYSGMDFMSFVQPVPGNIGQQRLQNGNVDQQKLNAERIKPKTKSKKGFLNTLFSMLF